MRLLNIVCLTAILILLVACQPAQTTTIKTDEGDVTVETNVKPTGEWCQAGAEWKATGAEAITKMIIQGIETSGKYTGYCYVKYDITSEQGQANVDLYFDEEGNGYQVMVVNGQTFESKWTK